MNFPKTVINLEALLYALTQQEEPLPADLQGSLQDVGQDLRQNDPDSACRLRELIRQYPPLEAAYQAALEKWDQEYTTQERAKSLNPTFPTSSNLDWLFIHKVTPTTDWVATTKHLTQRQNSSVEKTEFWDKTDRIAIMIAGGVALGSAIAQLPGAVIGGISAAMYGWYISFAKNKSVRNS